MGMFCNKNRNISYNKIGMFLGNIEKFPFTYWLNGRWFLQIVDRDSVNLYPIYPLFPCSDFFISSVGRGNVFLSFLCYFQHF